MKYVEKQVEKVNEELTFFGCNWRVELTRVCDSKGSLVLTPLSSAQILEFMKAPELATQVTITALVNRRFGPVALSELLHSFIIGVRLAKGMGNLLRGLPDHLSEGKDRNSG